MRRIATILALSLSSLVFITSPVSLEAQQAGVAHPMTLVQPTYGETISALVANSAGEYWFGGYTCSTTLPTTQDAVQRTWNGSTCLDGGLLGRMRADGSISYLSYFGGNGTTQVTALAVGPSGNLYVAGWSESTDFPSTVGAFQRTCPDGTCTHPDGFVAKLSPDGSQILFATFIGGSDNTSISSIAVDATGRIHIAGTTKSGDFPVTSGALQPTYAGGQANDTLASDGFYARLRADGSALEYATYLGGSERDIATGVALDSAANAYIVGLTYSDDFPMLHPVNQQGPTSPLGSTFLAKFSPSGAAYSTYVGASGSAGGAVSVVDDRVYITGNESWTGAVAGSDAIGTTATAAYIAELTSATGTVTRVVALGGATTTLSGGSALVVDQNHVAYVAGSFEGNDCIETCTGAQDRYQTTWDAYKRQMSGADMDAVMSIVDFGPQTPTVRYSTMLGGPRFDQALAVAPDGTGGAFFAGQTQSLTPDHAQPPPAADPGSVYQSFVAHVGTEQVATPAPPADIVLYANDLNANAPSAITGDWQIDTDQSAAGGFALHEVDHGNPKVPAPVEYPTNYFELTFLADANVPYHLWMRLRADADYWQNDSVWVQFSDSIDGGGNPIWRIHSADGTFVSLEDCSGCGEQAWGWNDNGYGVPGTPVVFATSGWHTIRIQQREDGVRIDQIVLSSNQWANTAPGANKNDTTILSESYAVPSTTTNAPPTVRITRPFQGDTYPGPSANVTVTGIASDSDGTIAKVDIYVNGQLQETTNQASFSGEWDGLGPGQYTFVAIATDNQGASTTSSPVTITVSGGTTGLPDGWTDTDVGTTGAQGSASYATGTFTVHGAGADVWGTSDAFNYVYQTLTGDGRIIARVAAVSSEANWVKAGVMIRSSLSPSSAQAFMLVSHAKGVAFQRRTDDGATSVSTSGSASTAPHWVELVRNGSLITAYESPDGSNWTLVGSDTFTTLPDTVLVGLAVSSHVQGTLSTATFDGVQVTRQTSNACSSVSLSQTSFYSGGPASDWHITVTAPEDTCTWTASIDQSWLLLNGVAGPATISGTGSQTLELQTLDNRTGAFRYGTFTIAGVTYKVTQEPE